MILLRMNAKITLHLHCTVVPVSCSEIMRQKFISSSFLLFNAIHAMRSQHEFEMKTGAMAMRKIGSSQSNHC